MSVESLSLRTNKNMINFGERIFGYIHPYTTGKYCNYIQLYDIIILTRLDCMLNFRLRDIPM